MEPKNLKSWFKKRPKHTHLRQKTTKQTLRIFDPEDILDEREPKPRLRRAVCQIMPETESSVFFQRKGSNSLLPSFNTTFGEIIKKWVRKKASGLL